MGLASARWPVWARVARRPDLLVLTGWAAATLLLALARRDYIGDGLRHLGPALESPALGEPRWRFFPAFVWLLLRPFAELGLATNLEGAIRPFLLANWAAGVGYLLAVDWSLASLGVAPNRRAVALAVAGLSAPLLILATNVSEPLIAATLAVGGLAWSTRLARTQKRFRLGCGVAASAVAAATLLYQGIAVAAALIPLAAGMAALRDRRAVAIMGAVLAAAPLVLLGSLLLQGDSLSHALERLLAAYENRLYREWMPPHPVLRWPVALAAGPPQGVVQIPEFRGVNPVIDKLRSDTDRVYGIGDLSLLAAGASVLALVFAPAAARRDWVLLVAFGAVIFLPVYSHLYGYVKFYVLLPLVLAIGVARLPRPALRAAVGAAVLLGGLNGGILLREISWGRGDFERLDALYQELGESACFLSDAWGPPFSYRWKGYVVAVLARLAGGAGEDQERIVQVNNTRLVDGLRTCFCQCRVVVTDRVTVANARQVMAVAGHFGFEGLELGAVLWRPEWGWREVESGRVPVFRYSDEAQLQVCRAIEGQVTGVRADATGPTPAAGARDG